MKYKTFIKSWRYIKEYNDIRLWVLNHVGPLNYTDDNNGLGEIEFSFKNKTDLMHFSLVWG